jgi:hypothetical protein
VGRKGLSELEMTPSKGVPREFSSNDLNTFPYAETFYPCIRQEFIILLSSVSTVKVDNLLLFGFEVYFASDYTVYSRVTSSSKKIA